MLSLGKGIELSKVTKEQNKSTMNAIIIYECGRLTAGVCAKVCACGTENISAETAWRDFAITTIICLSIIAITYMAKNAFLSWKREERGEKEKEREFERTRRKEEYERKKEANELSRKWQLEDEKRKHGNTMEENGREDNNE